jgi:hypothetical protein
LALLLQYVNGPVQIGLLGFAGQLFRFG